MRFTTSTKSLFSGLGLAVVARIIEQLGGQLRVNSKPGVGSTFSFLVPFGLHDAAQHPDGGLSSLQHNQSSPSLPNESSVSEIDSSKDSATSKRHAKPSTDSRKSSTRTSSRSDSSPPSRSGLRSPPSKIRLRILVVDVWFYLRSEMMFLIVLSGRYD